MNSHTFINLGRVCEPVWRLNSYNIPRLNCIFDWVVTTYEALIFELEHLYEGPESFINRYREDIPSSLIPHRLSYRHHDMRKKEVQDTMIRRFERLLSYMKDRHLRWFS
jgi:hypothetical protein